MTLKLGESSQKAVDELLSQGFSIAQQQDDYPLMPRDLTELDSEQLSLLFSRLTAWSNYVATQLSAAQRYVSLNQGVRGPEGTVVAVCFCRCQCPLSR